MKRNTIIPSYAFSLYRRRGSLALTFAALALLGSLASAASIFTIGATGTKADTNNFISNMAPQLAIDGLGTSFYLNFAKTNTGYIFSLPSGNAIATGINFTTPPFISARDPASFILLGSNSAVTSGTAGTIYDVDTHFTQIASGALALPAARNATGTNVTFNNSAAYSTFLLVFPTVVSPDEANGMAIGEAVIQTTAGPLLSNAGSIAGGRLTVVPEPSTMCMFSVGIVAIFTSRSRRK